MFEEWLVPHDLAWFVAHHLHKAPYAAPGVAANAVPLFQPGAIGRVLESDQPLDVLTVKRGLYVDVPAPRSAADVARLGLGGVSVVVRGAERNDARMADLAASFARAFPGEIHIQLYVTPAGTNSYGWHYDFEDVFIAQTAGVKDYYFRDNTVAREVRLGETPDFSAVRRETSPIYSSRLVAGDWLYIPARWWHFVTCVEDALSISVGVMRPGELRTATRLPTGWTGEGGPPKT